MSTNGTLEAPVQVMNLTDASEITVEFAENLTVADILAAAGGSDFSASAVINGRPVSDNTLVTPGAQVVIVEKFING
ncbi:MAG: hypothetical protein WAQ27_03570 [Candidatus Microsaccharimonas sp.]